MKCFPHFLFVLVLPLFHYNGIAQKRHMELFNIIISVCKVEDLRKKMITDTCCGKDKITFYYNDYLAKMYPNIVQCLEDDVQDVCVIQDSAQKRISMLAQVEKCCLIYKESCRFLVFDKISIRKKKVFLSFYSSAVLTRENLTNKYYRYSIVLSRKSKGSPWKVISSEIDPAEFTPIKRY